MDKIYPVTLFVISLLVTACGGNKNESEGLPIVEAYTAIHDFKELPQVEYPFYRDSTRGALAINAVKYKDVYASASTLFKEESGSYDVKLATMTETDGESSYKLFVNSKLVGSTQNPPTEEDYSIYSYSVEDVQIQTGDTIRVDFNSHSNGKIPEGDIFAYSRGRWKSITFTSSTKK